jgi:cytidine deaminase
MSKEKLQIISSFIVYDNINDLSSEEHLLILKSKEATKKAYAPYSNFHVGAAILLNNNEIVVGNNQENSAYPSGLCAERVAVFYAGATYPDVIIKCIAINSLGNQTISPCGSCRQALIEYEHKQKSKIKIILCSEENKIIVSESVANLLPLQFDASFLKR